MEKVLAYLTKQGGFTKEDAQKVTHLNLAFGKINPDGSIDLTEPQAIMAQMPDVRSWNPDLKIMVSLVNNHPDAWIVCSETAEMRKKLATSCAKLITEHDFDGVDFDWEYPCVPSNGMKSQPEDKQNFTLMLQAVREEIDKVKGDALLTIAAGADVYYVENVEMDKITPLLDYICVMTYDLKCGFHALSGHHTALYSSTGDYFRNSCDQAMKLFQRYGVPKEKLLMGAAFYSRQWDDLPDVNNGFLQLAKSGGGYGPNYTKLKESYIDQNGYKFFWDDEAKAPYLFNGSSFISYDDERSLEEKCRYVNREGLGGFFYWEHSSDRTGDLLRAIDRHRDSK